VQVTGLEDQVKPYRWRIALSTVNLAIAALLSVLGSREYRAFSQLHPHARYEGNFIYIPPAQLISDCINAPVFVLSHLVENSSLWRSFLAHIAASSYSNVIFYVLLLIFWWWIGWRIDIRSVRNNATFSSALFWTTCTLLSLAFLYAGIRIFLIAPSNGVSGGRVIGLSLVIWGLGLFWYSSRSLRRFHFQGRDKSSTRASS